MAVRIPISGERRDLSKDPWMTLGEAVRWAAWRGGQLPDTRFGDLEEEDRLVYSGGAEEVRLALAAGKLEAWAQNGSDEPQPLSKARWSGQMLGSIVTWWEFYHPYDRVIVERSRVFHLWPSIGSGDSETSPVQHPSFPSRATVEEPRRAVLPENELRLFWTPFWQTDRQVTADFEGAGRSLCGHHIVALIENAEVQILAFAAKAKMSGYDSEATNDAAMGLFGAIATDKRLVSRSWSDAAKEVLQRELARAKDTLFAALNSQPIPLNLANNHGLSEFDEPKTDWLELWQGPLHFRATYDRGKFGPGHSMERINQFGVEGATARGRHPAIYSVRLDADDGAVVIQWLIGLPGRRPPFQSVRYYHGGLGRGLYQRLRDEPKVRDEQLAHLPPDQRARAVGAYACGLSMREWAETEFFQAVHAGLCEIWARVGSKVAPFRRVPADIFRSYEIQEWGYGVPGGAWAKLNGAESLYSIRVAASESYLAQMASEQSAMQRMPYETVVEWCRDWVASGRGNGMDRAWAAFKVLPGAGGCARDTFFRPAWNEAKTKVVG